MVQNHFDKIFNNLIKLAKKAYNENEIPISAIIFCPKKNKIISKAHNVCKSKRDPLGHAEIVAIRSACRKLKTTKLLNFSIYITLEPCQMCEALIINVGIKNVYFGAYSESLKNYKKKLKNNFLSRKGYNFLGGFEERRCSK